MTPANNPTEFSVERIIDVFEALSPERVPLLGDIYAEHARFKDPFNDVQGLGEIQRIFSHMYVALESPHFVVTNKVVDKGQCFLTWEFRFRFRNFQRRVDQTILGGSHLVLNEAGQITLHRDYWDAAEELYEKLPMVGGLMRWLKRRANS
ncbi:MAG TPA: nuclear transport factor 2 family protein [Burkholderiaceae bacterium]|nr:nuclear transport factor 2 family protein [Burkholderiaceae bacterium]HPH13302.1 nuclear transport factor 2 family protein [Burkholderiaceae bacterium]